MIAKTTILKLSVIVGSYLFAGCFALAAIPQFKVQDEETLSGAIQSIQEALNNDGDTTIVLPAKEKRHPWSGFFALSSVVFACTGTGGLVWALFGKSKRSPRAVLTPPAILPPSPEVRPPETSQFQWPVRVEQPTVSPPPPQTLSFQQRQQQLFDKLAQSPQAWVLQLLEAAPLLIWGEGRSGKTELAQFIAFLRVLFIHHNVEINDPQAHLNPWIKCFRVYGHNGDHAAIEERLIAYQHRLTQSPQSPTTVIWEDYRHYPRHRPSSYPGELEFLKSAAFEAQKKEEFPILVSQSPLDSPPEDNPERQILLDSYFIQIHLFSQRSPTGRALPSGQGRLQGLTKDKHGRPEEIEISIPKWMQVHYLLEMFPEIENLPTPQTQQDNRPTTIEHPPQADSSAIASPPPQDRQPFRHPTAVDSSPNQGIEAAKPPSQRLHTIRQFIQFKQQGLNREQIIFQMWKIPKGDSQQWKDASLMYDRMSEEYKDFIEYRKSLDEVEDWE